MYTETHISKDTFFAIIQKRLFRYIEAIWGRGGSPNIASYIYHNCEKLKALNAMTVFVERAFGDMG